MARNRIAAFVHFSVPKRNAGSETMLHAMLLALHQRGHEVRVYATDNPNADNGSTYEIDGIWVHEDEFAHAQGQMEAWAPDVIVSHHRNALQARKSAKTLGIPWVLLIHNDFAQTLQQIELSPALTVSNTRWITTKHPRFFSNRNVITVHPPIDASRHSTTSGDHVTLVNMNQDKGAELFYWLAHHMPDVKFLGVEGGHGEQVLNHRLPNVEIVRHTSDMPGEVWSKTRVLLMPSRYESYGMAGVEAMASGIPVVAAPTEGLLESLSYAGLFVDRQDGQGWVDVVDTLMFNDNAYDHASALARKRSDDLTPDADLATWVAAIETLVERA